MNDQGPRKTADQNSYEGFYTPQEMQPFVTRLGISDSTIRASLESVGLVFKERTYKLDSTKVENLKATYCPTKESQVFFSSLCEKLKSPKCVNGCTFEDSSFQGAGIQIGESFVTAGHVGELLLAAKHPKARFQDGAGKIHEFSLEATKFSSPQKPYDFSVFRIVGWDKSLAQNKVVIRATPPTLGEPVYGIGFPILMGRQTQNHSYEQQAKGLRITFGQVVNANPDQDSFCQYTNEDDVTDIEAWKLEKDCSQTDYSSFRYKARQERDPFLSTSDMTFGMSGSPLFDVHGNLIGIGSNVLSNTA